MVFTEEFNLLLKRVAILYISSLEEDRIEYTYVNMLKKQVLNPFIHGILLRVI